MPVGKNQRRCEILNACEDCRGKTSSITYILKEISVESLLGGKNAVALETGHLEANALQAVMLVPGKRKY